MDLPVKQSGTSLEGGNYRSRFGFLLLWSWLVENSLWQLRYCSAYNYISGTHLAASDTVFPPCQIYEKCPFRPEMLSIRR